VRARAAGGARPDAPATQRGRGVAPPPAPPSSAPLTFVMRIRIFPSSSSETSNTTWSRLMCRLFSDGCDRRPILTCRFTGSSTAKAGRRGAGRTGAKRVSGTRGAVGGSGIGKASPDRRQAATVTYPTSPGSSAAAAGTGWARPWRPAAAGRRGAARTGRPRPPQKAGPVTPHAAPAAAGAVRAPAAGVEVGLTTTPWSGRGYVARPRGHLTSIRQGAVSKTRTCDGVGRCE
jgi:hypothetical protein